MINERLTGLVAFLFACAFNTAESVGPRLDGFGSDREAAGNSRRPGLGEFLLDTSFVYVPAIEDQWKPAVASDGKQYLVVWADRRGWCEDIYGARVDTTGSVLDPAGFLVARTGALNRVVAVAFGHTNYLVVWDDFDDVSQSTYAINCTRVSPSGQILDTGAIRITTSTTGLGDPAVVFDGRQYLVVWAQGPFQSQDIYGSRVTQEGIVLDSTPFAVCIEPHWQGGPAAAFDDTNYLVAWTDWRQSGLSDIYGTRVRQSGVVLDSGGFLISAFSGMADDAAINFANNNYMVVWADSRTSSCDIYGARVDRSGFVLDSSGIRISAGVRYENAPAVAFDGENHTVVWQDDRLGEDDIFGARVTKDGAVLDPDGFVVCNDYDDQGCAAVANCGTNYLAVWTDHLSFSNICGRRISLSGSVLDSTSITVSTAASDQGHVTMATSGVDYLAVWQDQRSSSYEIRGARVSESGTILDPAGFTISSAPEWQWFPSVGSDGIDYLVVWSDYRNRSYAPVYCARVSKDGMVLDPQGIPMSSIAAWQLHPSCCFGSDTYLAVWEDYRNGYGADIYGTRVTRSGNILDPMGIAIADGRDSEMWPAVSFDGSNFMVGWSNSATVCCKRVTQNGIVLDTAGISIAQKGVFPAVAYGRDNYLFAWGDYRNGYDDIYAARVSPAGTVLDPDGIPVVTALGTQWCPAVAYDGSKYVIVWEDNRTRRSWDLYGASITPDGSVVDTFLISDQGGNQREPAIVSGFGGKVLVTYSGWVDSLNHRIANTMRTWGKLLPPVEVKGCSAVHTNCPAFGIQPNPFRARSTITFHLSQHERVRLMVYNAAGAAVRNLVQEKRPAGQHSVVWDGRDDRGRELPNGVYFYQLQTGNFVDTKKAVILR